MGWAIGFDRDWNRDIGYGVPAFCDHPDCNAEIDRGLAYVCKGEEPHGGDGCGLYFCSAHLSFDGCDRCSEGQSPFTAKPDHPEWIRHKLTDDSWKKWRSTRPDELAAARAVLLATIDRAGLALDFNPWGFDESDYRVLTNRLVVTRKPHDCAICFEVIPAKTRARAQSEIFEGKAKTFHFCQTCCDAMAINREDDGLWLESRYELGSQSARGVAR